MNDHLLKRYAKLINMQAADEGRFEANPLGSKFPTREERYNDNLRYLRMRMPEIWEMGETHQIYTQDRLEGLLEHTARVKQFFAVLTRRFPATGHERRVWNKLDQAYHLIDAALAIANGEEVDEMEVVDAAYIAEV